ncbi:cytochrome-c peroxidase [Ruegeria meonggei]|uniref:Cytochrome c551 peroxidase n=1 Tax=Ruegeria meonggei TaxID=1446476 RepID=A0A1X7ACJ1_9RHOB|nr:cytochrome c peroxidase [Ruegeria meonggei]SLN75487.1 Cytochrome c551 peroxidase precursor [Ruegeria meonggei]
MLIKFKFSKATLLLGVVLLAPILANPGSAQQSLRLPQPLDDRDFLYDGTPPEDLVELGRNLFFDPILSGNRNISCGTCHDPGNGTGDGLALGIGEGGTGIGTNRITQDPVTGRVPRNAQALWNIGARAYTSMFHDGRVEDLGPTQRSPAGQTLPSGLGTALVAQAFFPVTSPIEMAGQFGENPIANAAAVEDRAIVWSLLASRVAAVPGYMTLLKAAFAEVKHPSDVTYTQLAKALAAFQTVGFRAHNSPFDRVLRTGDTSHLAQDARAGLALFYGDAGCSGCHSGPLLTDHQFHAIAMPQIGPGKGHGADLSYWRETGLPGRTEDEGRYRVTFQTSDLFAFRTPSLLNVAITGPWGHSGTFDNLGAVVRHHIDPVGSLKTYKLPDGTLPKIDRIQRLAARGSALTFKPLEPTRRDAFAARDTWVMKTFTLTDRIAAANTLPARDNLSDADVRYLVAFLETLTDPAVDQVARLVPKTVPSGLDPQPNRQTDCDLRTSGHEVTVAGHVNPLDACYDRCSRAHRLEPDMGLARGTNKAEIIRQQLGQCHSWPAFVECPVMVACR